MSESTSSEMRDVPGYEGLYAVTRDGRVWAYAKTRLRTYAARWMKQHFSKDGYLLVTFRKDGLPCHFRAHQVVAITWIGQPPTPTHEINHIDGAKSNNDFRNLEWVTRQENVRHAWDAGLHGVSDANRAASREAIKKANAANRHITHAQADEIRALVAGGMKKAKAGRLFGLTYWSVRDLVAGKTYRSGDEQS